MQNVIKLSSGAAWHHNYGITVDPEARTEIHKHKNSLRKQQTSDDWLARRAGGKKKQTGIILFFLYCTLRDWLQGLWRWWVMIHIRCGAVLLVNTVLWGNPSLQHLKALCRQQGGYSPGSAIGSVRVCPRQAAVGWHWGGSSSAVFLVLTSQSLVGKQEMAGRPKCVKLSVAPVQQSTRTCLKEWRTLGLITSDRKANPSPQLPPARQELIQPRQHRYNGWCLTV